MKTNNWQAQPIGSAKRLSPRLVALLLTLILVPTSLPPLVQAYFGPKAVWDYYAFEFLVIGVILSVGTPLAIHRTKTLQPLVGSGWVYRGLLALVAVTFAYPAVRIVIVISRWM